MSLLSLRNIDFTHGGPLLPEGTDLEINRGERVGLLGRNGAGTSIFMKLTAESLDPYEGEMALERGVRVVGWGRMSPREPPRRRQTRGSRLPSGDQWPPLSAWHRR